MNNTGLCSTKRHEEYIYFSWDASPSRARNLLGCHSNSQLPIRRIIFEWREVLRNPKAAETRIFLYTIYVSFQAVEEEEGGMNKVPVRPLQVTLASVLKDTSLHHL